MKTTFAQIEKTLEFLQYADFITEEQVAEADMMKMVALIERFKKDVDTTFNLEKDDKETSVCSGYISNNGSMLHTDLIIKESNPIGDRDTEEQLLLWIGCKES